MTNTENDQVFKIVVAANHQERTEVAVLHHSKRIFKYFSTCTDYPESILSRIKGILEVGGEGTEQANFVKIAAETVNKLWERQKGKE